MSYLSGDTIKELREKKSLTQKQLAEMLCVSDKTISKWETKKGYPDIGIIEDLASALGVSLAELMTGDLRKNENPSSNMKKVKFYICPVCGNIITAVGQGTFSCCGITLPVLESEKCEEDHDLVVETVENEYYVIMKHSMDKSHYISFIAYVTSDAVEVVKLYPEQDISVRFRRKGHGILYGYCNRHGLFEMKI